MRKGAKAQQRNRKCRKTTMRAWTCSKSKSHRPTKTFPKRKPKTKILPETTTSRKGKTKRKKRMRNRWEKSPATKRQTARRTRRYTRRKNCQEPSTLSTSRKNLKETPKTTTMQTRRKLMRIHRHMRTPRQQKAPKRNLLTMETKMLNGERRNRRDKTTDNLSPTPKVDKKRSQLP